MAQRTNDQMVKDVLGAGGDYDLVALPTLARYVAAATLLTDRVAACAVAKGMPLSVGELTEIETWLAAHYYTRSDRAEQSTATRGASATFQGQTGKGLEASYYGQTAMDIDPSGCLRAISMGQRAGVVWLGKTLSEQVDYVDRE